MGDLQAAAREYAAAAALDRHDTSARAQLERIRRMRLRSPHSSL